MKYLAAFLASLVLLAALPVYAKTAPKAPPPPAAATEKCFPMQDMVKAVAALVPIEGLTEVPEATKPALFAWAVKQLATAKQKLQGEAKDYDLVVVNHGEEGWGLIVGHRQGVLACTAIFADHDDEFLKIIGEPSVDKGQI